MRQEVAKLTIKTSGQGFIDITSKINKWISEAEIYTGVLTVFIQHTSASLTIQENADPDVLHDLTMHFERTVPKDTSLYNHTLEGKDDMPAHIRSSLTDCSLTIPVVEGTLALGMWQGVYVCEHRALPHSRNIILHIMGE